jgi:hypothetical protein
MSRAGAATAALILAGCALPTIYADLGTPDIRILPAEALRDMIQRREAFTLIEARHARSHYKGSHLVGPVRNPIRALLTCAVGDDLETVFVDGRVVVEAGRVVAVEEEDLLARTQAEAERLWATAPEWDWQGRDLDEISPPSFPIVT